MIFEANVLPSVTMKKSTVWPNDQNICRNQIIKYNFSEVVVRGCTIYNIDTFVCGNNFLNTRILPINERSIETMKTFADIENTRQTIYIKGLRNTANVCAAVGMDLLRWLSCLLRMK